MIIKNLNNYGTLIEKVEGEVHIGAQGGQVQSLVQAVRNASKDRRMNASEEKTREILLDLLKVTDEEGNPIFTEKAQWYAVYKVLSECHGYPGNMREFCDVMKNWGMDEATPACAYDSVRKVPSQTSIPTPKVALWHNYKDKAGDKFKKQVVVAMKLMEMLEE